MQCFTIGMLLQLNKDVICIGILTNHLLSCNLLVTAEFHLFIKSVQLTVIVSVIRKLVQEI